MRRSSFVTWILELILPTRCIVCSTPRTMLCARCIVRLSPPEEAPDGCIVLWSFRDARVRNVIHALKYRGISSLAEICGRSLAERLTEEIAEHQMFRRFTDPLIVAVPLAPKRLRERGFNQAALIARGIATASLPPMATAASVLERIKDTPPQARIKDKRDRIKNISGAFLVPRNKTSRVSGRDIILVDDVTTTGATLREAAKALKQAGAREVLLCAVAH
ncbi:MAG: hypothetical protein A2675_03010 [Candidatus Yonathbacteria bacterium RIFCSPHIGHO2_01_FULL_51_10]|uniref:Phosphoribosyltransferase domain-containing protein n=1 Tax=Candidatus Yonathbacteria bacterium RIFCSPHIGHO2_01_FULL_51_10 TaxID=1802723 RepID=A0A1G2S3F5_9BACT|nr:MAG: hypothetical protein A2675_03010 [Candidatus Yonathbacteria bacterium RIFCSPHIGHO2_01_FULL_51_10]